MNLTEITNKEPEMIIDLKSYRWIVSSCFQKSLRRGRFDLAETYLKFLWEHERNYITYRFGTILTEDVGIANLTLVNKYLSTQLAKKKIDEAGGLNFLLQITKEACESVKDRSSCDAANFASYYSFDADINILNEDEKIAKLTHIFNDSTLSYIHRIQAGWVLLGNKKFKNEYMLFDRTYPLNEKNEIKDDLEAYGIMLSNNNFPRELIDAFKNGYATQGENMSLGLPIIYSLYEQEKQLQKTLNPNAKIQVGNCIENMYIKETTIFQEVTNLHLISSGIDGHTREGKNAYSKFLKGNNLFTSYMKEKNIPYEQYMLIFSHCMFRTEGHEVNKRLYFPSAVNVMRDCEQKILNIKISNDSLDFNSIKSIIIQEMPTINKLREEQIKHAITPMIEKVEPKIKKKKVI